MTTREERHPLHRLLAHGHWAVLRAWGAHFAIRSAALAAAVITSAVLIGALLPSGVALAWTRLVLVLALCAGALALAVLRYRSAAPRFDRFLESVETRFPEVRSWLRNAVDFESNVPSGTSGELARAVSAETERRIAKVPIRSLAPPIGARRPVLALALAALAIVATGVLAPARITRSWTTLWNPALAAPPVTLEVEPGDARITPGAALTVHARVWGTTQRPDLFRDGDKKLAGKPEGQSPDGARLWRFDLTQLTRSQEYKVRVAGVSSPDYRISLTGEPLPVAFDIEYNAPAYARLPVQRGGATRGDLAGLRGTRAHIEVTFDRDLSELSATLHEGAPEAWKMLTARRWRGEIAIVHEGGYELLARAAQGETRFRYRITPLADSPPVLTVHVPFGDVDLPAGQQVKVEISGQDDLGLSELTLQYRKAPTDPWTDVELARFNQEPREAEVRTSWDAAPLALLPGESATFRFALYDNNRVDGRGVTLSPHFELRFPSLADLYQDIDRSQSDVQETLEDVAKKARELQKSLDKLARDPTAQPEANQAPAFERTAEVKKALERQAELGKKIEKATEDLRATLEKAAEREAFDEELTRKLEELQKLMDEIQSEEFKEAMRRMQEALENLDRNELEKALPDLQAQNQEMLENLERNIELLKRLRQEEKLDALAKRADELKDQQDALNEQHEARENAKDSAPTPDDRALPEKQDKAAEQSDKLAEETKELAKEMEETKASEALEETAEQLEQEAAEEQRESAESSRKNQKQQATQQGKKASKSLDKVARQLQQIGEQLRAEREGVDLAALRRAAQDLVSLQRETDHNLGSEEPLKERANQQTDLSEGVSRVADSLYTLSRRTPFISRELALSLGRAMDHLDDSGREWAGGNRSKGEASGREGSTSINQAVLELRLSEDSMCQSGGGGGGQKQSGKLSEKMGELGERQSQLNRDSKGLAKKLSEQMRLQAGDRELMRRMADEQQRIREQLEQIQEEDEIRKELLGRLDATQREMKDVEESLREGRTEGELEQKQQRILSRLLDAQRSVNRRDFNPERESRAGEDLARESAPELSPDLMRESDRLRHDMLKAESDRYPAQYRAFIEAYLRALNRSQR